MTAKKIAITFTVALILALAAGWFWVWHFAGGFSARERPSSLETFFATQARRLAVPANAKQLRNPVPYSPEVLEDARAHWADHCAFCHGNDGKGDTEAGRNLYPKPPDMRALSTQSRTDGELYFTINRGVRLTGMPAWGKPGDDDEDSWRLVYFIRHLPKMTTNEVEAMSKLNPESCMEREEERLEQEFLHGSPGKKLPNRKDQ